MSEEIPAEFHGGYHHARAQKCREKAIEATVLAAAARTPQMRAGYLNLKRQWIALANEIEHAAVFPIGITARSRSCYR